MRQHLIIDADDTLWENNVYFEQAFEDFVAFLNHEHLSTAEVQSIMDGLQLANLGAHGYGARAFARSLRDTFRHITGAPEDDPDLEIVERLGLRILDQEFEVIDGVIETIAALRPHHDLYMVTKGQEDEQRAKVGRSGIGQYFDAILISDEKNEFTYRSAVATLRLDPAKTWMIGNTPRSDINPALRSGINAIYVPHPRTWHLEVEPLVDHHDVGGKLLQLTSFRELTRIFASTAPGETLLTERLKASSQRSPSNH